MESAASEPNVKPVQCPVTIVGDVHGQLLICLSCLRSVDVLHLQIIYLWGIMSTGVTTLLKR